MGIRLGIAVLLAGVLVYPASAVDGVEITEHVDIHNEEGRFAGWPRNMGMWIWDDEIVVGFTLGYFKEGTGHDIDPDRPSVRRFARSLDGGETWTIEEPDFLDEDGQEREIRPLREPMDFTHPDFAFLFQRDGSSHGFSRFYYSYDRARTWEGPFEFPSFHREGVFARKNYVTEGPREMITSFTVAKNEGGEGVVMHAKTDDGGLSWEFVSWITPHPREGGYSIMPTTIRLSDEELLSVVRRRSIDNDERHFWIETFHSPDNGQTWELINKPSEENRGNPGHMIVLEDGRIVLVYGHRAEPFGQRARISSDNGQSWSDEIILRDDGANWDLGYPMSVRRRDGKIVTAYYHNSPDEPERVYLAATIWDAGSGEGVTQVPALRQPYTP